MGTVLGVVAGEVGGESGFLRRSRLTIAGGVRRDNWSKERIGYRWPEIFSLESMAARAEETPKSKSAPLKVTRAAAPSRNPVVCFGEGCCDSVGHAPCRRGHAYLSTALPDFCSLFRLSFCLARLWYIRVTGRNIFTGRERSQGI
jgi:hypothetical protein